MKKAVKTIQIYLDNAQSQPKISIIENGIVNENLPTNSVLTSIFDKTDNILLCNISIVPTRKGYKIVTGTKK